MDPPATYKSYLLRLWTATNDGEPVWLASLQNTATGQRRGFSDLESLFAYLATPAGGEKAAPERKVELTTDHRSLTTDHKQLPPGGTSCPTISHPSPAKPLVSSSWLHC